MHQVGAFFVPIYIFVHGDYPRAIAVIAWQFTSDVFKQRERVAAFLYPILNA